MDIKNLIYVVRDKQVMLDSDVANLYQYETKRIIETIRRNKMRFPENFCFQLTDEEYSNLRSQFATSSNNYGGRRYIPYVFTEQGIAMLSGFLKNSVAIQVSINIMNAFVEMRKFYMQNSTLINRLTNVEYKLLEHDKKFDVIFNLFQKEDFNQGIFYKGQIYDAFSLIVDIFSKSNKEIVIIDNYIDKTLFDLLKVLDKNIKILIITSDKSKLLNITKEKFSQQYNEVNIKYSDSFHDRFIIIDNKLIYHLEASIKDLGKKCFAISKMEDKSILEKIC